MSITDTIMKMPGWYLAFLLLLSLYYAIRGVMHLQHRHRCLEQQQDKDRYTTSAQRVIIDYIQEFLFKVVFTASAFIALFLANHIFSSLKSVNDIGTGTAVLMIFLLVWGITGVSGYLTYLIITGRFPR